MFAQLDILAYRLIIILVCLFGVIVVASKILPDQSRLQKYLEEALAVVIVLGIFVIVFWVAVDLIAFFDSSPSTPFRCPEDLSPADCDALYNG